GLHQIGLGLVQMLNAVLAHCRQQLPHCRSVIVFSPDHSLTHIPYLVVRALNLWNKPSKWHYLSAFSPTASSSSLRSPSTGTSSGVSSLMMLSSACLFMTMMLMRRFTGLSGFSLSNSTADDRPTTRSTLVSSMPPATSSRLEALARSAESSQLLYPRSPPM